MVNEENINNFKNALNMLCIPDPSGYGLLVIKELVEPKNEHLYIEAIDSLTSEGNTTYLVPPIYNIKNSKTGEIYRKDINEEDACVLVRARNEYFSSFWFDMFQVICEDQYIEWQFTNRICKLADKYKVEIVIVVTAFTVRGDQKNRDAVQEKAKERLIEYHRFEHIPGKYKGTLRRKVL